MRVLNLYAGLGGNRKLWQDVNVTAVEYTQKIANVYQKLFPYDLVMVQDAHEFLINHMHEYDFIWSSPPCQSHTKMVKATRHKRPRYAQLSLYEEIMLLRDFYEGDWVVENVVPYYKPLIEPTARIGRHLFWSNKPISAFNPPEQPKGFINMTNTAGANAMKEWLGIHYDGNIYYDGNHCPAQVLRNCVHPQVGLKIFQQIIST